VGGKIKGVLSYDVNLDRRELMSYLVSLTGLWRGSIRSQGGFSHTARVVKNMLHRS